MFHNDGFENGGRGKGGIGLAIGGGGGGGGGSYKALIGDRAFT